MSNLAMPWTDLWALYDQLVEERKATVTEQIEGDDFDSFMRSRSIPVVKEILTNSPIEIAEAFISLLPEKDARKIAAAYPISMHERLNFGFSHPSSPELFSTVLKGPDESQVEFWQRAIKGQGGDVVGDYARVEVPKDRESHFEFQRELRELAGTQGNPVMSARLLDKPGARIFYVGSDAGDKVVFYKPKGEGRQ